MRYAAVKSSIATPYHQPSLRGHMQAARRPPPGARATCASRLPRGSCTFAFGRRSGLLPALHRARSDKRVLEDRSRTIPYRRARIHVRLLAEDLEAAAIGSEEEVLGTCKICGNLRLV
eukprot:444243-Prymnesium_polylepis.1